MRSRRFTIVLVVLLAMFVAISALSFGGGGSQVARESTSPDVPARASVEGKRSAPESDRAQVDPHGSRPTKGPRAREALRRDIVRALERRGVDTDVDAATHRQPDDAERPEPAGSMVDRIGGRPELLERFNADFMPLADECIEQALERVPELRGMVAMNVKLLAERDVGAIVEATEPAEINEITEPELLECLQETLMSMAMPGHAVDGLDGIMISMPVEPGAGRAHAGR
jgi:hypothetical protein